MLSVEYCKRLQWHVILPREYLIGGVSEAISTGNVVGIPKSGWWDRGGCLRSGAGVSGGTGAGVTEQLQRLRLCPVIFLQVHTKRPCAQLLTFDVFPGKESSG